MIAAPSIGGLALWAGLECTVNRVGNRWFDQIERTGHGTRPNDLDRLADLGVSAVRYPVLWERTAPVDLASADWSWADARLARLRALGIRPIVGLLHHGSGPAHTSLVDPEFPKKFAAYARAVAERYPWVEDFTPINEPLTTARFSGLYGLWYPHGRDAATFARTLLTQCEGIAKAMAAIREVTPRARLVQTEDVGTIFSTRRLAYQATFENERRWLSLDLLFGRVKHGHPMRRYLLDAGIAARELDTFAAAPCPPDLIGINYYVTSDRFLDERLAHYPGHTHGGNGREAYADVEAVRVRPEGIVGHRQRLEEAWRRYRAPLALTEVHLGCAREEQLRWFDEAWRGAKEAKALGVDVRAVTLWSAFGAVDWDSLLTRDAGRYEPGAYDVRAREPRPTALVALARALCEKGEASHPVLAEPGWWRSERRITYPSIGPSPAVDREARGRPILITGATGILGRAFARACEARGLSYRLVSRAQMDIVEGVSVTRALSEMDPWAVINAAGYARIDEAQGDGDRCHRENTWGPATLAQICAGRGVQFVTFSSDLVFDGARHEPYIESDPVAPLSVFAWSKARAERAVLARDPDALIIRTSTFFGDAGQRSFAHRALAAFASKQPFFAPRDLVVSPTYLPDLVDLTLDLLIDRARGVWHLTNAGAVSYAEFAQKIAQACDVASPSLVACSATELGLAAPRPPYSALGSERGSLMPPLEDALVRFARDRHVASAA